MIETGILGKKTQLLMSVVVVLCMTIQSFGLSDRNFQSAVTQSGSITTQVTFNSLTHEVYSVRSIDKGAELSRENADAFGFRNVVLTKVIKQGVLKFRYERQGRYGNYRLLNAQLLWRAPRFFPSNQSGSGNCDKGGTASLVVLTSNVSAVTTGAAIASTCSAINDSLKGEIDYLKTDDFYSCLRQEVGQANSADRFTLLLNASPAQTIFSCTDGAKTQIVGDRSIELGSSIQYTSNMTLLRDSVAHEVIHLAVNSEEITSRAASCCAIARSSPNDTCDDIKNVPLYFKSDEHPQYGKALDTMLSDLPADQREKFIKSISARLHALSKQLQFPKGIDAQGAVSKINDAIVESCSASIAANICSGVQAELNKSAAQEVQNCKNGSSTCVANAKQYTSEFSGLALATTGLDNNKVATAVNKQPAGDAGSSFDRDRSVTYIPIAADKEPR